MNSKRSKRSGEMGSSSSSYGEMPHPVDSEQVQREQADESAGRAIREQGSTFVSEIGQEINRSVEEQKRRGLDAMRSFAGAVDTAAQELEQQSPQVARYVRDVSEGLQSFTRNIEGRNLNDLMRSATDLARSKPTLFMVGAVAAGFALARFMKSSARPETHEREFEGEYPDELSRQETEIAYGSP